jgi:hypothetical protein
VAHARLRTISTEIPELGIRCWADEDGTVQLRHEAGACVSFPGDQYHVQLVLDAILTVNHSLSRDVSTARIVAKTEGPCGPCKEERKT